MAFYLTDDGTMDTVVRCENCGREERYTCDGEWGDDEDTPEHRYEDFIAYALEDAELEHSCNVGDDE